MATPRGKTKSRKPVANPGVSDYLDSLEHPHKAAVLAMRELILSIDPRIKEEIKWNAPSFRIAEHFATFRLQPAPICQLVLHTGSKSRDRKLRTSIPDPDGLLKWASPDRCIVTFSSSADAKAKSTRMKAILKCWIEQAGVA